MKRLFVIMPFGVKRSGVHHDVESIDFDFVYSNLIRPAATLAQFEPLRIDEVSLPGQITHQYLKEILEADLVLADISLPNANVYYELGIRHAVSTGNTILIALEGSSIPFDLANLRVFFYGQSEEGLEQAREILIDALSSERMEPSDNPIRLFLEQVGATTSPKGTAQPSSRSFRGEFSVRRIPSS